MNDAGKTRQQVATFDFFTTEKCDALAVFAQADQRVTEVGIELLVEEVEANQRPPDPHRKHRGDDDVQVNQIHHGARNFYSE